MAYAWKAAVAAVAMVVGTAPGHAAPVIWNLNDVTFADGGTASGSFTYDAASDIYSDWTISVAGGATPALPSFTYTPATGQVGVMSAILVDFLSRPSDSTIGIDRFFRVTFSSALTDAGGTILLTPGTSFECDNCDIVRGVATGSVSASGAVPEPATWGMMLLGFGLAGASVRSRRRSTTVTYA